MKNYRKFLLVPLILGLSLAELGCASGGGSGTSSVRRNMDVLTHDEISTIDVGNLYEAVQRLRPRWLNVRSGGGQTDYTLIVYQGQTRLGDLSILKTMSPDFAQSLRFLSRTAAQAQLPGNWSQEVFGAIIISTSGRP